jgi:hypothetical protein
MSCKADPGFNGIKDYSESSIDTNERVLSGRGSTTRDFHALGTWKTLETRYPRSLYWKANVKRQIPSIEAFGDRLKQSLAKENLNDRLSLTSRCSNEGFGLKSLL